MLLWYTISFYTDHSFDSLCQPPDYKLTSVERLPRIIRLLELVADFIDNFLGRLREELVRCINKDRNDLRVDLFSQLLQLCLS